MTMQNYQTTLNSGSHWSLLARKGVQITLTDVSGNANVGMLFYNPYQLTERYNAPDTLKCQHTFKLTKGHCLYSDMGRIFASVTEDSFGWHESVCGNMHAEQSFNKWGKRDYQAHRNQWKQNGYDAFITELAKYRLTRADMAANINWFAGVAVDDESGITLAKRSQAGDAVTLRFEMDTLVFLHTCPHPMEPAEEYPETTVELLLEKAEPVRGDDLCMNFCAENQRGFQNNALYHFGLEA